MRLQQNCTEPAVVSYLCRVAIGRREPLVPPPHREEGGMNHEASNGPQYRVEIILILNLKYP